MGTSLQATQNQSSCHSLMPEDGRSKFAVNVWAARALIVATLTVLILSLCIQTSLVNRVSNKSVACAIHFSSSTCADGFDQCSAATATGVWTEVTLTILLFGMTAFVLLIPMRYWNIGDAETKSLIISSAWGTQAARIVVMALLALTSELFAAYLNISNAVFNADCLASQTCTMLVMQATNTSSSRNQVCCAEAGISGSLGCIPWRIEIGLVAFLFAQALCIFLVLRSLQSIARTVRLANVLNPHEQC